MTRDELAARLDARARAGGRRRGDAGPGRQALTPAAVLVPLIARAGGLAVLLTRRAPGLRHHPGQISFPGGRIDAQDANPEATALREAGEEIGLALSQVAVVGRLDDYRTGTGFHVTPVVGIVDPAFEPRIDATEVSETFEVPLAFLLDRANHRREIRAAAGGVRPFSVINYGRRRIWGSTAGMIVNMADILGR